MDIRESNNSTYILLEVSGMLLATNISHLLIRIKKLMGEGWSNIALDMSEVSTVDSTAISYLVEADSKLNICIYGLKEDILNTFKLTGLTSVLSIYKDEQAFLNNLDEAFC